MRNKLIKIIFLTLSLTILLGFNNNIVFAEMPNTLNIDEYTNDDIFTYNNINYTITDYANSIADQSLFGINVDYTELPISISDDDPITKIIPKDYFTSVGTQSHMGREYGFYKNTVNEFVFNGTEYIASGNLRTTVVVFDIINDVNLISNVDKATFTVKKLFELEFITVINTQNYFYTTADLTRENHEYDYQINYTLEKSSLYTVLPLMDFNNNNALTNNLFITDVSYATHLENSQDYNNYDTNYNVNNDEGSFFNRVDYYFDGVFYKEGHLKKEDVIEMIKTTLGNCLEFCVGKLASSTAADIILLVADTGIALKNIYDVAADDVFYNISNTKNNAYTTSLYVNKNEQISNYNYLCKDTYLLTNKSNTEKVLLGNNNYSTCELTINHGSTSSLRNRNRLTNEIAFRIVDKNLNQKTILRNQEVFEIGNDNPTNLVLNGNNYMYLLSNDKNTFKFKPNFSGYYCFNLNNSNSLEFIFEDEKQIGSNLSVEVFLDKNIEYEFIIKNCSSNRINQTFIFDIANKLSNITTKANDSTIIKICDLEGFNKISLNTNDLYCKLFNLNFDVISGMSMINDNANNLSYNFTTQGYYLLITNPTNQDKNCNVVVTSTFTTIDESLLYNINFSKGDNFHRFNPNTTGAYIISVNVNSSSNYAFKVYSDINEIDYISYTDTQYVNYLVNLTKDTNYYIGYKNSKITNGNFTFSVNKKLNAYQFYINGDLVENTIYLSQGEYFTVDVKVNNIYISASKICFNNSIDNIYGECGEYEILPNAKIGPSSNINIHVLNDESGGFINVEILPSYSISLKLENDADGYCTGYYKIIVDNLSVNMSVAVNIKYTDYNNIYTNIIKTFTNNGNLVIQIPDYNNVCDNIITNICIDSLSFTQTVPINNNNSININMLIDNNNANFNNSSLNLSNNVSFSGGLGTETNPYIITNAQQFYSIRNTKISRRLEDDNDEFILNKHFFLANDITLSTNFEPFPKLTGSLKGSDSKPMITINNLYTGSYYGDCGLFISVDGGKLENLRVRVVNEINRSGSSVIRKGVFCGQLVNGSIKNCYSYGSFNQYQNNPLSSEIGGIAGEMLNGLIDNCQNFVLIHTYGHAGGIIGVGYSGTINNCLNYSAFRLYYTVGSVTNADYSPCIGGIAGKIYYNVTINNCSVDVVDYGDEAHPFEMILYKGQNCNDKNLKPCLGIIVGRNIGSALSNIQNCRATISAGTLKIWKEGGLFGNKYTYNQLEYVATDGRHCGRLG